MDPITFEKDKLTEKDLHTLGSWLKEGKIGVIPTDTIYGVVCLALDENAVRKVYQVRNRSEHKPVITLIHSLEDLSLFSIKLTETLTEKLLTFWPGMVSIILPCIDSKFAYLHKGTNSLAFRFPKDDFLQRLLEYSGPLIAPSANHEGEDPATTIEEAKEYFNNSVNFYIDAGKMAGQSSTVIKIVEDKIEIIRQGAVPISI